MKNKRQQTVFNAKILLAGEYMVLNGGEGYAIPSNIYYGKWVCDKGSVDEGLIQLSNYIKTIDISFDNIRFYEDILKGLRFSSNIPIGSGLGSSGALIAACYSEYGLNHVSDDYICKALKEIESFYHGKSSGIDPIVSYYNSGFTIINGSLKKQNEAPELKNIYLYDTHVERKTSTLITKFNTKYIDIENNTSINEMMHLNQRLIHSILNSASDVLEVWKQISYLQFEIFDFAIPDKVKSLWEQGWKNNQFFKLCGAGGGGFYLVYSDAVDSRLVSLCQSKNTLF